MRGSFSKAATAALLAATMALGGQQAVAGPVAGIRAVPAISASAGAPVEEIRYRGRGGWGRGVGIGIGAGILGGALIGGALAAPYYDRPYAYYPAPRYYAPPPVVSDDSHAYCFSRFKSYDPRTRTYLGYDGYRHPCP